MTSTITKTGSSQREAEPAPQLFDDWFDPIETEVRIGHAGSSKN